MTVLGYSTEAERTIINQLLQRIIDMSTVFLDVDTVLIDYDFVSMSGPGTQPNLPVCSCRFSKGLLSRYTKDMSDTDVLAHVEML